MVQEIYRQSVHIIVGVVAALTAFFFTKTVFLMIWSVVIVAYLLMTFAFHKSIKWVFFSLERESAPFRGKGGLFYFVGVLLVGALFYEHAVLAILLLAIPDSLATLLAHLIKSPPLPFNRKKSVWGSLVFFVSAALLLSIWYQETAIFFVAFLLMALESFDYSDVPFLDDNLVIPVVAGFLLQFL